MSMSSVPWSTFARCRTRLAIVDIRPPIGVDGRHSTVDLSRPEIQDYMSNYDFSQSHLSSGLVARFAASSGWSATRNLSSDHEDRSCAVAGGPLALARWSIPSNLGALVLVLQVSAG